MSEEDVARLESQQAARETPPVVAESEKPLTPVKPKRVKNAASTPPAKASHDKDSSSQPQRTTAESTSSSSARNGQLVAPATNRGGAQQALATPATVPDNLSVRDAFAQFLEAGDLPEMRAYFKKTVELLNLEDWLDNPLFYAKLRSALLPQLNFKQKAVFKVRLEEWGKKKARVVRTECVVIAPVFPGSH